MKLTVVSDPQPRWSLAFGMNSIDEIVGAYVGQDGHYHGYLRTP